MQFSHRINNNTLFHSWFKDLSFFMHKSSIILKHPHEAEAGAAAKQFIENIFVCIENYI